jgi:hypothetical protein
MNAAKKWVTLILVLAFMVLAGRPSGAAQDQPSGEQEKAEKETKTKEKEKKKKGGFFSGLKAVSGSSSEQQELTATAGTKGVGEGEEIGNITPTTADRNAVSAMERYMLPEPEVKKFQADGRLKGAK